MTEWPDDAYGDMEPILAASVEAAKARHPSGATIGRQVQDVPGVTFTLTAADRCDAECPAAALYRVAKGTALLDFCGHHWGRNSKSMTLAGWAVVAAPAQ